MQILQKIKKNLEDTSKKQNKLKQKRNLEKKWIYA